MWLRPNSIPAPSTCCHLQSWLLTVCLMLRSFTSCLAPLIALLAISRVHRVWQTNQYGELFLNKCRQGSAVNWRVGRYGVISPFIISYKCQHVRSPVKRSSAATSTVSARGEMNGSRPPHAASKQAFEFQHAAVNQVKEEIKTRKQWLQLFKNVQPLQQLLSILGFHSTWAVKYWRFTVLKTEDWRLSDAIFTIKQNNETFGGRL